MATIELKLRPLATPNFVQAELPAGRREDGPKELPSFPIGELSKQSLDGLVAEFLTDLYKKAGKPCNWALG